MRLTDQAAALARVAELVDAEQLWRADRRAVVLAVLRRLVCGMSWETGLVAGVTRAHLAAGAECSVRTVSRVVAWAIEAGVVVCVETGATAEFLGTECNRAPSYVLTVPTGWENPWSDPPSGAPVEEIGNPPAPCVKQKSPRRDRGLQERYDEPGAGPGAGGWPVFDLAKTAAERAAAADTLLKRTGLGARVVRWRARALLGPWFEAGWCVAGLLHALDHHPGQPTTSRGDAARAARHPLAVLGHRLRPWVGHLEELPSAFHAVDGPARRRRAAALAEANPAPKRTRLRHPGARAFQPGEPAASPAVRAAARAEMAQVLERRGPRPYRSSSRR